MMRTRSVPQSMGQASPAFITGRNGTEQAKTYADRWIAICDSGSVPLDRLEMEILITYSGLRMQLADAAATGGINSVARTEYDNQTLDYVAFLNSAVTSLASVLGWMETNWPQDVDKKLALKRFTGDGFGSTVEETQTDLTWRNGLKAQLQGVSTAADINTVL